MLALRSEVRSVAKALERRRLGRVVSDLSLFTAAAETLRRVPQGLEGRQLVYGDRPPRRI